MKQIKYLIVKLNQSECEFDYEAFWLVDNWQEWYTKNSPDYFIEVYEFTGTGDKEAKYLYTIYDERTYQQAVVYDARRKK